MEVVCFMPVVLDKPSGGVVYLRIVLSPEQGSRM